VSAELKKWAGDLARNTQDVVAVANQMEVIEPSVWDFRPAWSGLLILWRDFIGSLPTFGFGLLILAMSVGAGMLATLGARAFLLRRISANLLRSVIACGVGVLVFLFGAYIVLRVCGLTQLALTVVGGTGLIGLAVGLAFRDITENFLASIVLSMQRPFETGDLLEVVGVTGYVCQGRSKTRPLGKRKVLILPFVVGQPDQELKRVPVLLTSAQIRACPPLEADMPVARQYETGLKRPGSHLRSLREVLGYSIHTTDGEAGSVKDFIIEDTLWGVHHAVVALKQSPSRSILVSPKSIRSISWPGKAAWVNLSLQELETHPDFDPATPAMSHGR
jgi:hypothetical protein